MTTYALFNLVFAAAVAVVSPFLIKTRAQLRAVIHASLFITVFAYPWDFFAVHLGVWEYAQPGPLIYGVPLNDSVFIFVCMFLGAAIFCSGGQSDAKHGA